MDKYTGRCLELAKEAAQRGEIPVGAVVVRLSDGRIIGEGSNECEEKRLPTLHAEMNAINAACRFKGGWRLDDCVLYTSLEPCAMCAGAAINSHIKTVYFGARDTSGRGASALLRSAEYLGEDECSRILKDFFRKRRMTVDNIRLIEAVTDDQLRTVAEIADEIWHEHFPKIIGAGQTDYMVDKFCTFEAEKENIEKEGYIYYKIKKGADDLGYTAIKPDGDRLFLSKLYLRQQYRGKGYSRQVLEQHKKYAAEHGFRAIWLTVNRGNDIAIRAYEGLGFDRIGSGVADIGGGYVMDDYYFEIKV